MALESPHVVLPYDAGEDLSTHQYKVVKVTNTGTVVRTAAVTDFGCGIVQNNPENGKAADVAHGGRSKAIAAAAIAVGAVVGCTADGRVQTAVSTQKPLGICREAAAAANDIISIILFPTPVPLA